MPILSRAFVAFAVCLGLTCEAIAAPDPAQAPMIEQQVRAALGSLLPPQISLPERPVSVTPQDDHFRIEVPLAPLLASFGQTVTGIGSLSGTLQPLQGGHWAIDNLALPMPSEFSLDAGASEGGPVVVELNLRDQVMHAIIAPIFDASWSLAASTGAADIRMLRGQQLQTQHFDGSSTRATLAPLAGGQIDVSIDSELRHLASRSAMEDGTQIELAAGRVGESLTLDKLDRGRIMDAVNVIAAAPGTAPPGTPPAEVGTAIMHAVLKALHGVTSGGALNQTFEQLVVSANGQRYTAGRIAIGMSAHAPADLLEARLNLAIEAPGAPGLPPNVQAYLPTHVALQPYVSGVSVANLTRYGLDATAPGAKPQPADAAMLYSDGGITAGIDSLSLTVGLTAITGSGEMTSTAPGVYTGHATISASHLDALAKTIQSDPTLGPQAAPVMLLLRGMARQEGELTVWDIAYVNGKLTVNDTDFSALLATASPKK